MANIKISELPAASAASATQEFETNDSGTSKKVTGSQLKSFIKDGLAVADVTDLTATAAELNVLDGITASTSELNYTDGVTGNIQTQLDSKATIANPTFTGTAILTGGAGSGVTASMQIRAGNNDGASTLAMGDSDSASIASISYSHANDYMSFITNGGTRFRLGASGEWGIGSNYGTVGKVLKSNGTGSAPSWASSATLLGTLTTTSGTSQTLSGLDLTGYSFLIAVLNSVSGGAAAHSITMESWIITATTTASAEAHRGIVVVDLSTGVFSASCNKSSTSPPHASLGTVYAGDVNLLNSSTSITFAPNSGSFDAGSIRIYGV